MAGTFIGPLSQWLVFWLLARVSGPTAPGEFATLLAYATPLFTAAGWGLRNTCITLRKEYPFAAYLRLRVLALAAGSLCIVAVGAALGLHAVLVIAVTIMKIADGVIDILYAPLQKSGALLPFGLLMILNGALTVLGALVLAAVGGSAQIIVLGSSFGSVVTAVVAIPVVRRRASLGGLRPTAEEKAGLLWRIIVESTPVAVWQVLAVLVVNLPTWVVSIAGSAADVGRFSAAAYILTAGSLLGASLNSMYIGDYRMLVRRSGRDALISMAGRTTRWVLIGGIVAAVVLHVLGPPVFSTLYGRGFDFESLLLSSLTIAATLNAVTQVLNAALLALNRYRNQVRVAVWSLLIGVVAVIPCGALGVSAVWCGVLSALVSSIVKTGMSVHYVRSDDAAVES